MIIKGELIERMTIAFEHIAARLPVPDYGRVEHLEDLLKEFMRLMEDQQSTDKDWADLLSDTKQALGRETQV